MRWAERRFVSPLRGSTGFHRCGRRDSVGWHPRLRLCQRYALPSPSCHGDLGVKQRDSWSLVWGDWRALTDRQECLSYFQSNPQEDLAAMGVLEGGVNQGEGRGWLPRARGRAGCRHTHPTAADAALGMCFLRALIDRQECLSYSNQTLRKSWRRCSHWAVASITAKVMAEGSQS